MHRRAALAHAPALALAALLPALPAAAVELRPVTLARGLQHPWGLAFLPDGRMLVTERPGRMRIVERDGRLGAPLAGLPAVDVGGQGGLLDVALDPRFAANRLVYWSYTEADPAGGNRTAVARGRLEDGRLADVQVIFRQQPSVRGSHHFGSRLVFGRDGRLFVTLGDRFSRMADAQTLDNHLGKIVRIEPDGRVPADNPFVGRAGALPEIWSYGHRNVQGAALHPATGALWTHDHGPQGGDELNLTQRGGNHGWPVITHGRNYGLGTRIGEGTERADVVAPLRYWVPTSIAPSGMAFVTSARYPEWRGSLLIGTLRAQVLLRLSLEGERVVGEQTLLGGFNARIRDVRQGPDGWIYLLTDERDGRIVRLER
jgi:glucose/arabinose dehydrogenase